MANQKLALLPWHVLNEHRKPKSCVVFLPGRANSGALMGKVYYKAGLREQLLVSITPRDYAWYPMPNGANDQVAALAGQERARLTIEDVVTRVQNRYGFSRRNIVLCGYSAGGVMAIQVAAKSEEAFAGVVVHAGAILDTEALPPCTCPETIFLLTHCRDDLIFEWEERYVPMKNALLEQGYNVWTLERDEGGHMVDENDLMQSKRFIEGCLNGEFSNG